MSLGTQSDRDFDPLWFGFGSAGFLLYQFAYIAARYSGHAGIGRHVIKSDTLTWDVSAGAGYTEDRYIDAADINGQVRKSDGRPEALVAAESTHKWTRPLPSTRR